MKDANYDSIVNIASFSFNKLFEDNTALEAISQYLVHIRLDDSHEDLVDSLMANNKIAARL